MTSTFECTLDWLHLKLPNLTALWAGILLGSFGLLSLGIMVWVLAPASLVTWMPLILLFCSANGGYKLMEKRDRDTEARLAPYLIALAGMLCVLATAIQIIGDTQLFTASPSGLSIVILAGCALAGTWAGYRLRLSYEHLGRQES